MTIEEQVEKALNEDIDLSDEEMKKKHQEADKITKAHGVEGDAPIDEEKRLARMTMNFYGSILNVCVNLLGAVNNLEKLVYQQNAMIASLHKKVVTEEAKNE